MSSFDEEMMKDDDISSLEKKLRAALSEGLVEVVVDEQDQVQLTFTEKGLQFFQKRLVEDAQREGS